MSYEVTLKPDLTEMVEGADAYAQEGPLTTFFQGRDGRAVLDCWARRLASFRTADIVRVRWAPPADTPTCRPEPSRPEPSRPAALRPQTLPWAV